MSLRWESLKVNTKTMPSEIEYSLKHIDLILLGRISKIFHTHELLNNLIASDDVTNSDK